MYYISVDCGTKNLAIVFYKYNNNYLKNINDLLKTNFKSIKDIKLKINLISNDDLKKIENIIDNVIDIKTFKLINLLEDKKLKETNIIDRSLQMKKQLDELDKYINQIMIEEISLDEIINVHVEYQMNINNCSLGVMNQFIYHYTNSELKKQKYKVKIIYPALKNKLFMHDKLKHKYFIEKCNSNYKSNKEHSKYNLLYFLYIFKKHELIKDYSLKKIDDLADSLLQSLVNLRQ
jgi:hypothetical protein